MDDATLDEALTRDRVVVFHAPPRSRLARAVETAAGEASVPFLRTPAKRAPASLSYYEHGERLEHARVRSAADVDAFVERVEALQPRWRLVRGRMRVDPFG
jgi:hypothetical protein